jgi:hypothetical protein
VYPPIKTIPVNNAEELISQFPTSFSYPGRTKPTSRVRRVHGSGFERPGKDRVADERRKGTCTNLDHIDLWVSTQQNAAKIPLLLARRIFFWSKYASISKISGF